MLINLAQVLGTIAALAALVLTRAAMHFSRAQRRWKTDDQPVSARTELRCDAGYPDSWTWRPGRPAHPAEGLADRLVSDLCRGSARRRLSVRSTVPGAAGDHRRRRPDAGG